MKKTDVKKNILGPKVGKKLPPKPGSREYAKLQAHWYGKLRDTGFQDIEWLDEKSGKGHDSFIKQENKKVLKPERFFAKQLYYLMADAYILHNTRLQGEDRFLFKHHASGKTYQEIVHLYKKRYRKYMSIYTVFYRIQQIAKKCAEWNKISKYGCLHE